MAPTRSKKRKSTELQSSVDVSSFPVPQAHITTMETRDPAGTPPGRSPARKVSKGITMNQKQALIDNLQLESIYYISPKVERNELTRSASSHRAISEAARAIFNASSRPSHTHRDPSEQNSNNIEKGKDGRTVHETKRVRQARQRDYKFIGRNTAEDTGIALEESYSRESKQCST